MITKETAPNYYYKMNEHNLAHMHRLGFPSHTNDQDYLTYNLLTISESGEILGARDIESLRNAGYSVKRYPRVNITTNTARLVYRRRT